jgi:hypothetical protein
MCIYANALSGRGGFHAVPRFVCPLVLVRVRTSGESRGGWGAAGMGTDSNVQQSTATSLPALVKQVGAILFGIRP